MANATGRVVQILGGVVDVEIPREDIPDLFEAIEVQRPGIKCLFLSCRLARHLSSRRIPDKRE